MRILMFDFDGTLADTFPDIVRAVNSARHRFELEALDEEYIRKLIGYGLRHFMSGALPIELRDDATIDRFTETYRDLYRERAMISPRLFDGMLAVLDDVADETLAVVSNKSIDQLEPMLKCLDIYERFDCVVGGDSLTVRKPDPRVYDHVLAQVGHRASEVWMVGDSEPDIEFGLNAKGTAVGCLWGLRDREELSSAGAHHLVEAPQDLQALIAR